MIPLPPGSTVFPDGQAVALAAAEHLRTLCDEAPGERIAICLSGGSTPRRLYELLAGPDYAGMPWSRMHWFFGDDRVVPWDDALSNVRMVREAFGAGSPIPEGHLHPMPTDGGAEAGARRYSDTLRAFHGSDTLDPSRPFFDLVLLGLGEDGHIASLFPGMPALDEDEAWVAPVPEAGMTPFVPRITLTFPVLASARSALFLVSGSAKQDPLSRLAAGVDLPAGRAGGPVRWFIDHAAAGP